MHSCYLKTVKMRFNVFLFPKKKEVQECEMMKYLMIICPLHCTIIIVVQEHNGISHTESAICHTSAAVRRAKEPQWQNATIAGCQL